MERVIALHRPSSLCISVLLGVLGFKVVSSTTVSVSVGDSVTLPCDGAAAAGISEEKLYIQWKSTERDVWQSIYGSISLGRHFEGRAEVPRERIRQRDFSLTINSTLLSDEGLYECYYKNGGIYMKFLGSVQLTVTSVSKALSLQSGAALSLPLFTAEPVEVLFAAAGEGASVSVCAVERGAASCPGPGYEHRVSVQSGSLTLRSLTAADQGNYTVRDSRTNRTISSVSVSVSEEDPSPSASSPPASAVTVTATVAAVCVSLAAVTALIMWLKRKTLLQTLCLKHYPGYEKTAAQIIEANCLELGKKSSHSWKQPLEQ
ncbi:uncharacterized protein LOC136771676 [Amia ocellicauda]|uniref:uncharacterized protein LOC136771676 n=1 Tax=Amia ocellicauda TaxID=2972642 RepID=UPI003464B9C7